MKFKRSQWLLGFFIFLTLIPSWVSANISENPRQGSTEVFSIFVPGENPAEPATTPGFQPDDSENSRQGSDTWHWGRHHAKVLTPFLFASRRLDSFSNLYNNRNRYYQPKVGRFTSRDPIGFEEEINLYRYAWNNPIILLDAFGLAPTFSECLWKSVLDHYGLTGITGISGLLAIPWSKTIKSGAMGATHTTNVLSELGSFFQVNSKVLRNIVIQGRATPNLFRLLGRANAFVFPILLGVDAVVIGKSTYDCMNEPCQKP